MDVSRFDKRRLLVARCALGFASFKVAQSSLYSTAMLTSETTTVLIAGLDFSIASAAFVVLTEAVIVALALLGRLPRLSMPVVAPSLVLAATAVLSYSGALSSVDPAVSLMALAFAQGTATVMLTLAWVEITTHPSTSSDSRPSPMDTNPRRYGRREVRSLFCSAPAVTSSPPFVLPLASALPAIPFARR